MERATRNRKASKSLAGDGWSGALGKMRTGVMLFVAILVFAVAGYVAAGWSLDDSIYMTIITVFGVGYGEVQPIQSPGLRILTMLVIISGYGAVIYTVGGFMQLVVDGELQKALGERRMTNEIDKLSGHVIICGVGRMGTFLAQELAAAGRPFIVIDSDTDRLEDIEHEGYLWIHGDATEESILQRAGIQRASALATVLSDDALNVFVSVTARGMNPKLTIIARGENPRTEKKLLGCGANKVVLPTAIGAKKLAYLLIRPSAENMLEDVTHQSDINEELGRIGVQFGELEVAATCKMVDRKLSDIQLRSNHGFLIVGLRRADGSFTLSPSSETTLKSGDNLIVLGRAEEIPLLAKHLKE